MNSLPKHILKALKENKTSLGEHPSYPPEEEEKFIVNLVTNTFNVLSEKVGDKDYDTSVVGNKIILELWGNSHVIW